MCYTFCGYLGVTSPDSDNINNENNNECKDEECQDASMNVNKDFTFSRHDNQEVNQNGIQNADGTLTNSFEGNNKDLFAGKSEILINFKCNSSLSFN